MLIKILRRLYRLPPEQWVQVISHRLNPSRDIAPNLKEILSNPPKMRPQRLYDFLSRYQAIIRRHYSWDDLIFEGKNVLEIGCGPLIGWAPLAIFLGCKSFTCVEPYINKELLTLPPIVEKYFLMIYKDLSALYGSRKNFDEYFADIVDKTIVIKQEFHEIQSFKCCHYDILLSNSCLEHILHPNATIRKLKEISTTDCRFIHLIDFGNHRATRNPFEGLYEIKPEAYFAKYGRNINLLRSTDFLQLFRDNGFEAKLIPYYYQEEFFEDRICQYWTERYVLSDLFLKTALIVGSIKS